MRALIMRALIMRALIMRALIKLVILHLLIAIYKSAYIRTLVINNPTFSVLSGRSNDSPRSQKLFHAHQALSSRIDCDFAFSSQLNGRLDESQEDFLPSNLVNPFDPYSIHSRKYHVIFRYDETVYPDLGQVMGNRQSAVFKITMAVYAKSVEAKDDLRAFVWDFGQEYNQTITLEDVEDYMMTAALHPAQVRKNTYFCFRVLS